jgi:Tfp pilus assembly protein PilO
MKTKKQKQIPLVPVLAAVVVIVLAAAFLLLVKPKRDESKQLAGEIGGLQTQILSVQNELEQGTAGGTGPKIKVADLFRLAKAMPDSDDMPGIILELNAVAQGAGLELLAVQPDAATSDASYQSVPISLTVDGTYFGLSDFLFRLRNLVNVRHGTLDASGRLYTVDAMDVHQSKEEGFPAVEAVVHVTAYSYGADSLLGAPGASDSPTATTSSGSTDTSTTTTTTTTTTEGETTPAPSDGEHQALAGGGS